MSVNDSGEQGSGLEGLRAGGGTFQRFIGSFFQPVYFRLLDQVIQTERLGFLHRHRIGAAERIAVVLDQPKIVFVAKLQHGAHVEGIAQRVSHHHRFSFAGLIRRLERLNPCVSCLRIVVDEYRDHTVLQNRSDGRGKAGGGGDDLVAGSQAFVLLQLVGREGRERYEICR